MRLLPVLMMATLLPWMAGCTVSSTRGDNAHHWQKTGMTEDQRRADFSTCRRHAYKLAGRDADMTTGIHHRDDRQQQQMMARYDNKRSYQSTLTDCMKRLGYYLAGTSPTQQQPENK